jgi:hypothetical protein
VKERKNRWHAFSGAAVRNAFKRACPLRREQGALRNAQRVFRGVAQPRNGLSEARVGAPASLDEKMCPSTFFLRTRSAALMR